MLITPLESQVYGVKMPTDKEVEKAKLLKGKANLSENFSTLKGFWLLFHQEIIHLNPKKINSMNKFFNKVNGYRKYRNRVGQIN
jgi:hypothetical protein